MPITSDDKYITTSSFGFYKTKKIKRTFDTQISELSFDGNGYDYLPGPVLKVLSPNGGETVWIDEIASINWTCEAPDLLPNVQLYCKIDNGSMVFIGQSENSSEMSYEWNIPNSVGMNNNAKILISGVFDGDTFSDDSDNTFIINKRYLTIDKFTTPIIRANVGNKFTFTWVSNGTSPDVKIEMLNYSDNIVLKVIEPDYVLKTNSYEWTLDGIDRYVDKVKIRITDIKYPRIYDVSSIIDLLIPYVTNASIGLVSYSPSLKLYPLSLGGQYNPSVRITNFSII